ncbi:MAG: P-type conjugative transfer protein TrbL, partial [Hellea sp.]|nr:P-type conjugative transfer protein TrbL [Hellea sp.]
KVSNPVSESYNGGLRGGLNALSQKGLKPTSKESNDNAPNWAKRVQRDQKRVHATNAAHHTLRSGDRPGSGTSPTLNNKDDE